MEAFKGAAAFAFLNFGRWKRDFRIWVIFLFAALLVADYLNGYTAYAVAEGKEVTFCLLPLLYYASNISIGAPKVLFYTLFILLVCDAPFSYRITPYAVMRSGRRPWWAGECAYVALAALSFMLFLSLCCLLVALPAVSFGNAWGSGLTDYIFGTDSMSYLEILEKYPVGIGLPTEAVRYLNPLECGAYTFFTGWASMTFLGLTAYLVNLLARRRFWGVMAAAFFVMLDPIMTECESFTYHWSPLFSPVSWTSIEMLDYVDSLSRLDIPRVCLLYGVLLVALVAAVGLASRKIVIEVTCDEIGD